VRDGLGEKLDFDEALVVPDKSLTIENGGIAPLGEKHTTWLWTQVEAYCKQSGIRTDIPIEQISVKNIIALIYGTENTEVLAKYKFAHGEEGTYKHKFIGILPTLRHQYNTSAPGMLRRAIEEYMTPITCPECHGGRLKASSLSVLIDTKNVQDIVNGKDPSNRMFRTDRF